MIKENFSNKFKELSNKVSIWIEEELKHHKNQSTIAEIYEYSLLTPGKRIRPVLTILASEMFGLSQNLVKPFALAVEYLHTASLIHDDLPALDNDDLRRGRPTSHKVFGEAFALLAGDALIAKAFSLITSANEIDPKVRSALCKLLAEVMLDLCEGQVMDLQAEGRVVGWENKRKEREINPEKLLELRHLKKTGALLTASIVGVTEFLAEETRKEVRPFLEEFGRKLGLLFQITDDLLDVTSSVEDLGKNVRADGKRGLSTYVSVFGVERSRELAREVAEEALKVINKFGEKNIALAEIVTFVLDREK